MKLDDDPVDMLLKMVICGEANVGKTNLISRFIRDTFEINSRSTIGVEFYSKHLIWENKKVNVNIFDTVGQEKYRSVCSGYFRNCDGVVLVFDVTDQNSFTKLHAWKLMIAQSAKISIPILLIGNKIDLEENRRVTSDEAQINAKKEGFFFMETSAKTNQDNCVNKAFEIIISEIFNSKKEEMNKVDFDYRQIEINSLKLHNGHESVPHKSSFCCNW